MDTGTAKFGLIALLCAGCVGGMAVGDDDDIEEPWDETELLGAAGRDLRADWPSIDMPYSQNTQMLTFDMLRNEVMRATGQTWIVDGIDAWGANRSVLGGADYVTSWAEDRTPSQQKLVTVRKMALSVCEAAVAADAGQQDRTLFDAVDPSAATDASAAATTSQVQSLFRRMFLIDIPDAALTDSLSLLADLSTSDGPSEAWRGLCVAYLSSMRFLSY